jgi:hypothetical protein
MRKPQCCVVGLSFGAVRFVSKNKDSAMMHNPELPRADEMPASRGQSRISPEEALDQLIIRAHYLALDLRVAALEASLVDPAVTLLAADFLRYWAVETGKRQPG